jgi:hypothetical protein
VAVKHVLCGVLQVTLLCGVAEWSTPDKPPTMLSHEAFAFARAEVFINETARPLERALFACGSSPLGAMKALRILSDVGAPASDPRVKAVIRYLLASFDEKQGVWHALPEEANSAPHASWWDIESLIDLVRMLPPGQSTEALRKLKRVLDVAVVRDAAQWNSYNVKPLTFVHSTQSPLYTGMEEAVASNLGYIISTQKSDGGWGLTWSWEERNPTAWKLAEKEWRGAVTLESLQTLDAFHRIAR